MAQEPWQRQVRRAKRARQRVVVVRIEQRSAALPSSPTPPPPPSRRARLLAAAKLVGAAGVGAAAIAALFVSMAAYRDQHAANQVQRSADQAAAAETRRQAASQVSWSWALSQGSSSSTRWNMNLNISNNSNTYIDQVDFAPSVSTTRALNSNQVPSLFEFGTLPPCSVIIVNITFGLNVLGVPQKIGLLTAEQAMQLGELYFTNQNGNWVEPVSAAPARTATPYGLSSSSSLTRTIEPSTGCT